MLTRFFPPSCGTGTLWPLRYWSLPWQFFQNLGKIHPILDETLSCPIINSFTINMVKFGWAIQGTDWTGYWLAPTRLKPWNKCNSEIFLQQESLCYLSAKGFLHAINTYRLMWSKQAHLLKLSLTNWVRNFFEPIKSIKHLTSIKLCWLLMS